jgi:hypothetical protein
MKLDELKSIAHNIAHSLASGLGIPIGYHLTDIFDDAARSPGRSITVDFLTGTCSAGMPSLVLTHAVNLYKDALADLCTSHGTSISAFRQVTARYSADSHGKYFIVTIEDENGRRSDDTDRGVEGRRPMVLDQLGRVRRQ